MNRREFFKYLSLLGIGSQINLNLLARTSKQQKFFILLELSGGNDGLNMVIPYSDNNYLKLRPSLAIKDDFLPLNNHLGLHPVMKNLYKSWHDKDLAIMLGVGYPHYNKSHFRSIRIWDTGSTGKNILTKGWMSHFNLSKDYKSLCDCLILGKNIDPFVGGNLKNIHFSDTRGLYPTKYIKEVEQASRRIKNDSLDYIRQTNKDILKVMELFHKFKERSNFKYTRSLGEFGEALKLLYVLMTNDYAPPVMKLAIGGFDTHKNQKNAHSNLLRKLSDGLSIMKENLQRANLWDKTVIMTYSEFGRRANENSNRGTDHGVAAPHFILGGKVKGKQFIGEQPSLERLVKYDLMYNLDYRRMYSTILANHFNISNLKMFKSFKPLDIIKS